MDVRIVFAKHVEKYFTINAINLWMYKRSKG